MQISDRYNVTGYFYVEQGHLFRKYLNIRRKRAGLRRYLNLIMRWFTDAEPDLMVVMMNPGSSSPMTGSDDGQVEVAAKPDDTQRQIMKVMDATSFNYARILNLSDLRDPNSPDFLLALKPLDHAGIAHSIFGPGRESDFDGLFDHSVPVILAWGADDRLKPLARRALGRINNTVQVGQKKPGTDWVYYHARQRGKPQQRWVDEIVRQIN